MKKSVKDILFYSASLAMAGLFGLLIYSAGQTVSKEASVSPGTPRPVIVIDAGHGGEDGGAVAEDGTLEKDINLSIASYLNELIKAQGFQTVMTRTEDVSLGDSALSSVKERYRSNMQKRVEIMNSYPDSITISIHQNKFEQSQYSGVQVFYSVNDEGSIKLAEAIRSSVTGTLQPENHREVKPSSGSIYILDHAQYPAVLVECGFLSNPEELSLLKDESYQRKMAQAIFDGFAEYYTSEQGCVFEFPMIH